MPTYRFDLERRSGTGTQTLHATSWFVPSLLKKPDAVELDFY